MTGTCIDVGINEPIVRRVVVAGLEVIETGFGIVVVTTIAKRVEICEGGAGGLFVDEVVAAAVEDAGQLAPCIVGIGGVDLFRPANEISVGILHRQGAENFNHVALLVQRIEVCYVAAAIIGGILDCKGSALGIVGEDHDLGRAVCAGMLFLALKISLIWFYQKCCKQRKCMCMIQNIAGSRK